MIKALTPIIGLTFLVQLTAFLLGIANNVIISRWLGAELLGIFATFLVITEMVNRFVNPGLDISTLYFLSNQRFPLKKVLGNYFTNGLLIFGLGLIFIFILVQLGGLRLLFKQTNAETFLTNIWFLIPLLYAFITYEFGTKILLGLQQFKRYNLIQMLRPLIIIIMLVLSYFFWRSDLLLILCIWSIGWLFPGLFSWKTAIPFRVTWDKGITIASLNYGIKVMFANPFLS